MFFFHNKAVAGALALVCLLSVSLSGCQTTTGTATTAQATTAQTPTQAATIATAVPVESLQQQEDEGSLRAWELSASAWSSNNGATITVKAQPREYQKGQAASFVVRLEGSEVENRSCQWDGTCYTASVDLNPANGYEFDFILFPPQGSGEHFSMGGAYDTLVNLENSLSCYCNLFVSDYKIENGKFNVTAGFANVQLPQLNNAQNTVAFEKARLIFSLDGNQIDESALSLPAGEGTGSYEAALSGISFKMPDIQQDYQLSLTLEVTLSDGRVLTAEGGSWTFTNGEAQMEVG